MFSWIFRKRKTGLRSKGGFEEKEKAISNKHELARNIMERLKGVEVQRERRFHEMPDFVPNRRGA